MYIVSNYEIYAPKNSNSLFAFCIYSSGFKTNLTSINFNNNFNTTNMETMAFMFERDLLLTSLDLSSFKTTSVKSMNSTFHACSSLTSLDLSNFNTSNVTDMSYMFYLSSSLTSLKLSSFNTSNVTDMRNMFFGCSSLKTINFGSSFDTSKVTNMIATKTITSRVVKGSRV